MPKEEKIIKRMEKEQKIIGRLLYIPEEQKRNMYQCLQKQINEIKRKVKNYD